MFAGGGSGNPIIPIAPPGDIEHPVQYEGGPPTQATPPLGWRFVEPVELLDEGWGHTPATIETSITFSAELYGTRVNEFKGKIYFSVDGKQYPFQFQGNIFTTVVSGLGYGIHNIHLLAASAIGEAARTFEFEVLDKAPDMQLGLGIDDGKIYISLPRPMPSSQLGDSSRWTVLDFNAEKQNITVLAGNDTVVIELSEGRTLDDPQWLPSLLISPRVSFNSSLGIMNAFLFPDRRPGQVYNERSEQVLGCEKGTVFPLGSCNEADDWDLDRTHLTSEGKERREILNAEAPTTLEGCPWGGGTPWANCQNYAVSQFNWALEAHLDPQTNWDAQYDTLDYSSTQRGYFGVGFSYGHWQHYERNRGYFVPSTCRYRWESRVDCNNCDGSEPYGYESKGFRVGEDTEIPTDTTCPVFDNEDGIVILPGEDLNDYVQNTLIPELNGMGAAYAADGTSNLWSYYWSRCGNDMDEWLQANPGGLCFVVRAKDDISDEGQWIHHYLSIDYEDGIGRHFLEDEQLHYFYVDIDPYANTELTYENWPRGANCNSPLPTDGYPNGEYSVWILRAGCDWLNWTSCKLRIKDDCHNWRRSDNLVPGANFRLDIWTPDEGEEFEYDEQVTFMAALSDGIYDQLPGSEEYIQWEILTPNYKSIILTDLTGSYIDVKMRDNELTVKASLFVCGAYYFDTRTIRSTSSIEIEVEPGPYWIDGPSIPIMGSEAPFHDTNIRDMEIEESHGKDAPEPQNTCEAPNFTPSLEELEMSQVKVKITTTGSISYVDIVIKIPSGEEFIKVSKKESEYFVNHLWLWNISGSINGQHEIIVRGFAEQNSQDPIAEASITIELEWLEPSDLISVAEIYDGHGYLWGGDRCPDHPWPYVFRDKDCNGTPDKEYYNGVLDCSHYVYQGLMRLGRGLPGYNLVYRTSTEWQNWNRVVRVGWMDSIASDQVHEGDIILWHKSRTEGGKCEHIAIFLRWGKKGKGGFYVMDSDGKYGCGETFYKKVKGTYEVFTWQYNIPGENNLPVFHQP